MKLENFSNNEIELSISKDELLIIKNCVTEVCSGMHVYEFQTRIGFRREEVVAFAKELKSAINDIGIDE